MVRVAINGFGRIGRAIFRICVERNVNVVAINDIHGVKDAEYLLKYDSIYGKFKGSLKVSGDFLIVNGKKIKVLSERDPEKLPWKELKVDFVVESTGVFRDREGISKHFISGAKKVVVTAPAEGVDVTIVPSVNDKKSNKNHKIISVASCTTNAAATVINAIDKGFSVKKGFITTVHAYTSSQSLVDASDKKPRRGRAAGVNIVPTSTGAARSVCEVIPKLKDKIDGIAIRVPVVDGSLIDLTLELKKKFYVNQVNSYLKNYAKKHKNVLEYSEEELVSTDILMNSHSAVIDGLMTRKEGNLLKVMAWYDNEWGYSNRVVDCLKML